MKKIFALVIAIALTLALAVPALADGEDAAVFGTELNLVANDPTVEYDEWDVPYNVWNVIPADTKLNVGDTVNPCSQLHRSRSGRRLQRAYAFKHRIPHKR